MHVQRCFVNLNFIIAFLPFSLPSGSPSPWSFLKSSLVQSVYCACVIQLFVHLNIFNSRLHKTQVKIRIQGTVGQKCFETFNSSGLKCSVLKSFLVLSFTEDIFYHIGQFFRVETSGCRPFFRALYKGLNWRLACRTMARPVTLAMKDSFSKIFGEKISPSSILFRIDIPGVQSGCSLLTNKKPSYKKFIERQIKNTS